MPNRGLMNKLFIFLFMSFSNIGLAQVDTEDPFQISFYDLIVENEIINFKSGALCTAIRNDTLFIVFYTPGLNDLELVPLVRLSDNKELFFEGETVFSNWVGGRSISSTVLTNNERVDHEECIIKQTLNYHTIIYPNTPTIDIYHERLLFYNRDKGLYKIEYFDNDELDKLIRKSGKMTKLELQNLNFILMNYKKWPYKEGDFIY
ncbi:hypothetical protein AVL50_18750 [Flammeovirga sp. SJP92]|nr:hypothetical protein AVL50_18750 [Flammeovirga sp. SJP92]